MRGANPARPLSACPVAPLSTAGADSLAFMREEEPPARDVCSVGATLWNQPVFANIAAGRATHPAAV